MIALGGAIVLVFAAYVAHYHGPQVGGLFLAFPAILPASLILVEQRDGRAQAVDDVFGACLGSIGLAAFALVTWWTASAWPAPSCLPSQRSCGPVSVAAWIIVCGRD